jgi:hypothetical protein
VEVDIFGFSKVLVVRICTISFGSWFFHWDWKGDSCWMLDFFSGF